MLTEEQIITIKKAAIATDPGKHKTGSTLKPDWHDRPTEPGLWLVHAKGSRTDVMACTIVTDEMMACIDEAIDADIDYCGPYALPPDTKEEK